MPDEFHNLIHASTAFFAEVMSDCTAPPMIVKRSGCADKEIPMTPAGNDYLVNSLENGKSVKQNEQAFFADVADWEAAGLIRPRCGDRIRWDDCEYLLADRFGEHVWKYVGNYKLKLRILTVVFKGKI